MQSRIAIVTTSRPLKQGKSNGMFNVDDEDLQLAWIRSIDYWLGISVCVALAAARSADERPICVYFSPYVILED
jgi:hypothetical protein